MSFAKLAATVLTSVLGEYVDGMIFEVPNSKLLRAGSRESGGLSAARLGCDAQSEAQEQRV